MSKKIKKVSIDSRTIEDGDIFIALKGKNYDGNDYIDEAIEKGASLIVTEKEISAGIPTIKVEDTYKYLLEIGRDYRKKFKGDVIAITGSAGKTTTKELIGLILSKKYKVLKSEGNQNNHIGMPLTLTKLNNSYDICVLELGMNHLGEISNLSKICNPNVGIITNIGTAHIGNLGSKKNIFKAKMEILDGLKDTLIVNGNDKYLKKIKSKEFKTIKTDYEVTKITNDLTKTEFCIKKDNKEYKFTLNMMGPHLIQNCLIAIKVGERYGISFEDMIDAIKEYKTLEKRLDVKVYNDNTLIDDCYNSNYESVKELINYIKSIKQYKLVILADILELGNYSKKIHKKIGKLLKKCKLQNTILIGENMYYAHKKYKKSLYFKNNDECIEYLKNLEINNSIVLVKGSRGMHLEIIFSYLEDKLK